MRGTHRLGFIAMARPNGIFAIVLLITLSLVSLTVQAQATDTAYIYGTDIHGVTRELAVDRYPALYTGDFGDCLGGQSLFNITKFDAAYYTHNLTIVFHLDGTSNIRNDSLMSTQPFPIVARSLVANPSPRSAHLSRSL